jgi:hypothetical protein
MFVAPGPVARLKPSAARVLRSRNGEAGIALAPILFLLAIIAIIAAVASSSVGGFSANTTTEGGKITASAIIRVGEDLQNAVRRVSSHGCTDTQINFNNPVVSGYTNPNAPTDGSCDVFGPNGGAMTFPMVTASVLEQTDAARFFIQGFDTFLGQGTGSNGILAAFLPVDSQSLCQQINGELGLGTSYVRRAWYNTNAHFNGSNYGNGSYDTIGFDGYGASGPPTPTMACFTSDSLGISASVSPYYAQYFFYVILLIR